MCSCIILLIHGDVEPCLYFISLCNTNTHTHIEYEGIPHRTAMIHYNTGITEVEYFGKGEFYQCKQAAILVNSWYMYNYLMTHFSQI